LNKVIYIWMHLCKNGSTLNSRLKSIIEVKSYKS